MPYPDQQDLGVLGIGNARSVSQSAGRECTWLPCAADVLPGRRIRDKMELTRFSRVAAVPFTAHGFSGREDLAIFEVQRLHHLTDEAIG